MRVLLLLLATFLILQVCNSYILLTANMEDVHALVKQLSESSVVDRVKKIWRRASIQFKKHLNPNTRRAGEETIEDAKKLSGYEGDTEPDRRTRRIIRDLVALGKESGYLEPIKQILQKFE